MADNKVEIVVPDEFFTRLEKSLGAEKPADEPSTETTAETETEASTETDPAKDADTDTENSDKEDKEPTAKTAESSDELMAKVTAQGETLNRIVELFEPGDADNEVEPGAIMKALQTSREDVEVLKEVIEKALDRIEQLESRTVRKSIDGQEVKTDVKKSKEAALDDTIRSLALSAKKY